MPREACFIFMSLWQVDDNRVVFVRFATSIDTATASANIRYLVDLDENFAVARFWLSRPVMASPVCKKDGAAQACSLASVM